MKLSEEELEQQLEQQRIFVNLIKLDKLSKESGIVIVSVNVYNALQVELPESIMGIKILSVNGK